MNNKVNSFNIAFKKFLNDKELLGDIRTGVAITLALLLPLAWFGLFANVDIYALLNYTVGGLVLFVVASLVISWVEISIKAKRDEIEDNTELKELMESTYKKQTSLPKVDNVIKFNNLYNFEKQVNRDMMLNEREQKRLQNKIDHCKIKGKSYKKYERKLNRIDKSPMVDTTYKPIKVENIVNQVGTPRQDVDGNDSIVYNPVKDGFIRFLFMQPFKGFGLGGIGTAFILSLGYSWWTIIVFYVGFILMWLITVIPRYLRVRFNTSTKYMRTYINISKYIDEFYEWYNLKEKGESIPDTENKGEKEIDKECKVIIDDIIVNEVKEKALD